MKEAYFCLHRNPSYTNKYAEYTHGTYIDSYFTHNSIEYINCEYSDTYSQDRIQIQICNDYIP